MYSRNKNIIQKTVVGISLSLAIAITGNLATVPKPAHAATYTTADQIISTGKKFMDVEYEFGAKSGQTNTFDCSSFVQYVYGKHDIELPRNSRQQSKVGTYVKKSDLQPGDLIFSDTNRDDVINHVSIYMGNDKLLHTYRVGIGVTISDFSGSAWDKTYVTARRVIENDQPATATTTEQTEDKSSAMPDVTGVTEDDREDETIRFDRGYENRWTNDERYRNRYNYFNRWFPFY